MFGVPDAVGRNSEAYCADLDLYLKQVRGSYGITPCFYVIPAQEGIQ